MRVAVDAIAFVESRHPEPLEIAVDAVGRYHRLWHPIRALHEEHERVFAHRPRVRWIGPGPDAGVIRTLRIQPAARLQDAIRLFPELEPLGRLALLPDMLEDV